MTVTEHPLIQTVAKGGGLTLTDIAVLLLSDKRRVPAEQRQLAEIAETLAVFRSMVTRVAERLERHGYAERVRHPDDRRRFIMCATIIGEEFIDGMEGTRHAPQQTRLPKAA